MKLNNVGNILTINLQMRCAVCHRLLRVDQGHTFLYINIILSLRHQSNIQLKIYSYYCKTIKTMTVLQTKAWRLWCQIHQTVCGGVCMCFTKCTNYSAGKLSFLSCRRKDLSLLEKIYKRKFLLWKGKISIVELFCQRDFYWENVLFHGAGIRLEFFLWWEKNNPVKEIFTLLKDSVRERFLQKNGPMRKYSIERLPFRG